jgi:hypothetical protein
MNPLIFAFRRGIGGSVFQKGITTGEQAIQTLGKPKTG